MSFVKGLVGIPGAFGSGGRKRTIDEAEEESFDETQCRSYLGSILEAGETVMRAMNRLKKENKREELDLVSKRAMQLSDNGYIEVYTDPREKIWAHSYAANLTAEEVLFGANAGEPAPQEAFIAELPQPENNELDFNEPGSWWQYCVLDENGQAGEYHGPFAGEHMLEWQAQGYFSGGNVHVFRYEGVPPQQEHAAATYHQPDPLPESPCIGEHTTMQGRRPYQEDRCVAVNDLYKLLPQAQSSSFGGVGTAFYGVFDGHQGFEAADWCVKYMATEVAKHLEAAGSIEEEQVRAAITSAFAAVDTSFLHYAKKRKLKDGCTACTALILGKRLYVANIGDSRCVLSRNRMVTRCSQDHSPGDDAEKERIKAAGGEVVNINGTWRVKLCDPELEAKARLGNCESWERPPAMLAVSRSIGDRQLKAPRRLVDSTPDITMYELGEKDKVLLIACDGVWDVMNDQEAVDLADNAHDGNRPPLEAARRVVTTAYSRESVDNLTCVAIYLDQNTPTLESTLMDDIPR